MGDLDGDGDLDIVLAKGRHDPYVDKVLLNDGRGRFVTSNLGSTADLAVGDEAAASLTVYMNDGTGRLIPGFHIADKQRTPYAMTAADLNGDRHPDIVLGYTEGPHSVFFNDGSGKRFVEVTFGDKAGAAYGFAIGDINGDGRPDIALARSAAPNVLYLNGK